MIRKGLAIGAFGAAAAVAMGAPASAHGDNDGVDVDVQDVLVDVEDTGQVATNNDDGFGIEGAGTDQGDEQRYYPQASDDDLVDLDVQHITVLLENILQGAVND